MSYYWANDVCLTIREGWLDGLEDFRDDGLNCGEWFLVQFDEAKARFLHVCDHFADSWYEELGLYV